MNKLLDILGLGSKIIDKVIPDPAQRQEAKLKLMELQQKGEFKEDEMRYDAIGNEAKSDDVWTSRARPTFLYVMYAFILFAIPFAIFYSFEPDRAVLVADGMKAWLNAIPGELYTLFGVGYMGYTWKRTEDKKVEAGLKKGPLANLFNK